MFIVLGVLAVAAAPTRWILGLLLAGAVVAAGAVHLGVLDEYQVNRFAAFANPDLDPRGAGYNTNQARIAIGSGGVLGKGLFQGTQTNGRFIPEQQTDFVFTVAGRSSAWSAPAHHRAAGRSSCGAACASPPRAGRLRPAASPPASCRGSRSRASSTSG